MGNESSVSVEVSLTAEVPIPGAISESSLADLAAHALREEGQGGTWQLGMLLTSDPAMQAMHLEFMGLDSPTDIMTFPYDADDPAGERQEQGGDIVISVDTARAHAEEAGWPVEQELRFLLLHGVLHILGWDDEADGDRARMLERQAELLDSWTGG